MNSNILGFIAFIVATNVVAADEKAARNAAIIATTRLSKDCAAVGKTSKEARAVIEATWRESFELVRSVARANGGDYARRIASTEVEGKQWPLKGTVGDYLQLLARAKVSIGECAGNLTACTKIQIPPSPSYTTEIVITPQLVANLCSYLKPKKATVSSALVSDLRYAGIRAFVLGHEAAHVMLDPYTSLDFHPVWREIRGDIAGLQMTKEIEPEKLIDPRMLPLSDSFRRDVHGLVCMSGFLEFFNAIESAGLADDPNVAFAPRDRREAFEEIVRDNKRCER